MNGSSREGFGFDLENGNNRKAIFEFLLRRGLIEEEKRDDFMEDLADIEWEFTEDRLSEVVAAAMNEETGYACFSGYASCSDCDTEMAVGYEVSYPWLMTPKDKAASREEIAEVLKKYGEELGITEEPDFFTKEYWG